MCQNSWHFQKLTLTSAHPDRYSLQDIQHEQFLNYQSPYLQYFKDESHLLELKFSSYQTQYPILDLVVASRPEAYLFDPSPASLGGIHYRDHSIQLLLIYKHQGPECRTLHPQEVHRGPSSLAPSHQSQNAPPCSSRWQSIPPPPPSRNNPQM